jgi:hypothetical protein
MSLYWHQRWQLLTASSSSSHTQWSSAATKSIKHARDCTLSRSLSVLHSVYRHRFFLGGISSKNRQKHWEKDRLLCILELVMSFASCLCSYLALNLHSSPLHPNSTCLSLPSNISCTKDRTQTHWNRKFLLLLVIFKL